MAQLAWLALRVCLCEYEARPAHCPGEGGPSLANQVHSAAAHLKDHALHTYELLLECVTECLLECRIEGADIGRQAESRGNDALQGGAGHRG